ncbi:MAG: rhodanese-related sulfurtransferase [Alphaproteobacteria bacterium]|nr:rhodanese-related sulfurtransferase [Alphaproteobacteria bacterium]
MTTRVAALYHFTRIEDPASKRQPLLDLCLELDILGTLLLAHEGINGTVAGPEASIRQLIAYLESWDEIEGLEVKYSTASSKGFLRMKVRLKNEIVTMGKPGIDPRVNVGTYVEPKDWNELISRQDVMLVDTRNIYETRIGQFKRAVDPETETFRAFPEWADQLAADPDKPAKVAMYCTGGIRCEKASAYMKQIGFEEVYHLKGGILKYLEEVPEENSLWEGECFVFDERVSLKHGLEEGEYELCFACKDPISDADRLREGFEDGVSCHRCITKYSPEQQDKFRERQRQIKLAEDRGEAHLGHASFSSQRKRKML